MHEHRLQKCADRALAVGSGDMYTTQLPLRMPDDIQKSGYTFKTEARNRLKAVRIGSKFPVVFIFSGIFPDISAEIPHCQPHEKNPCRRVDERAKPTCDKRRLPVITEHIHENRRHAADIDDNADQKEAQKDAQDSDFLPAVEEKSHHSAEENLA